ncbi:MAG: DUF5110 domain-containing protein [Bacteroidales bacterium]|nr:DUF5110 domain-containing protein [Bacteroidales bacterium]
MRKLLFLSAVLVAAQLASAAGEYNPVAAPGAQVVAGNARFTVLTDRLVRMEWSAEGRFEDHATLAIVNRNLPVPKFTVTRQGEGVTIKTPALTLTYKGGGKFTESNLQASFRLNGKTVTWRPGADASGNLMGTARTLDGCMGPDKINNNDPMEPGILSRDGWAVVDESARHLFVESDSDWGEWVAARPDGEVQDLYLFAYGHDYKAALADYAKVAGRIPMPPKFVFGYWWSRYWAYTDDEFVALAEEFRSRKLPIDVMVIDMDWHETWQGASRRYRRDEFGQSIGWTGYTWNSDLFADPEGFLADIHSMNLKTSLNLHPASGIVTREKVYPAFVADYLSRTDDYDGPRNYIYEGGETLGRDRVARKGYHASVPFRMDQVEWADAYFNSVIHPLEKQGVDFWWLDWQQWKESKYIPGLSNTFWLNYTFFNDKVRASKGLAPEDAARPMIYHRWGGLGSHRYQLGFSGDTNIRWEVLGYLPYFTATSSNVLYGYWGHDLGGHMQRGDNPTDPELYTRWLQYGVFSPIFKTHSTSSAVLERRFWAFPDHYEYMKEALELRYALTPYIYDMARQAYETGVSLCRPLYYEYPEEEKAYTWKQEYFFGDNILAATVCEPVDETTGTAGRSVWLPAGNDWYDMAHHTLLKGGQVKNLAYSIDQNAWFVKAGAIIPMAEEGIQHLQQQSNVLRLYIAPGKGRSTYVHYEDDQVSQAYPEQYACTQLLKNATASTLTLEVGARQGSFKGMAPTRKLSLILGGLDRAPRQASLGGKALSCTYNPATREAVIDLPESAASEVLKVEVKY